MLTQVGQFTFKNGEISLKEFHQLPYDDKINYVYDLMSISSDELSTIQKHIVKFYSGMVSSKKVNNFYTLDIEG
jgi:hypothetical protein